LRLHPIPEDSPTLRVFKEIGERLGVAVNVEKVIENACLRITEDWETYYKSRSRRLRSRLRKLKQSVYDKENIRLAEFSGLAEVDEALQSILEIEGRSWKSQAGVPINASHYGGFYFELAKVVAAKGWLKIFVLKTDGGPIAYQYYIDYMGSLVVSTSRGIILQYRSILTIHTGNHDK
jgi:hypothetical protein